MVRVLVAAAAAAVVVVVVVVLSIAKSVDRLCVDPLQTREKSSNPSPATCPCCLCQGLPDTARRSLTVSGDPL